MTKEQTLAIIKPDAFAKGFTGAIISRIEKEGFQIAEMRLAHLTKERAEGFYYVHKERPFFSDLVQFMTSGPVVLLVLERENAILHWRNVMGATNPAEAEEGTIRKQFGENIEKNATHGSDAPETARFEVGYFFGVPV